jgi:type IV pilus assembly protein PilP
MSPRFIVGLFWLGMLSGCEMLSGLGSLLTGGDASTDEAELAGQDEATKQEASPLDHVIAAQEEYVYNPIGRRDPFRSFLATYGARIQDDTPRTPLQRYEISEYSLVGIIWGVDQPRSLVEDPVGIGHVMELGTYIGKNWGKVTQITASEVVVTEEFQNLNGDLVVNTITLALPITEEVRLR